MKKLILTTIALLAFCGSIFAQPESHWNDFNPNLFADQRPVVAFVQIDGVFITENDDYENIEVAPFVEGLCRGHEFMIYDGDPYPIVELTVNYTSEGEPLTFQMYDHSTGTLYPNCACNMELVTGVSHDELYFDYDEAVILNFSLGEGITKTIEAYTPGTKDKWYLIASPVGGDNVSIENLRNDGYDLYMFDQSAADGKEWINDKNGNFQVTNNGIGYLYANSARTVLTFNGELLTETEMTLTLARDDNDNVEYKGWNLMGNPFNANASIGTRDFYVMNGEGTEVETPTDRDYIEPMEGFFVIAETNEEPMNIYVATNTGNKTARLALNVSDQRNVVDRAIVNFNDRRALPKFQLNPNHTKVYFPMDDQDYATVSCQGIGELPVNFKAEKTGTYTLSFDAQEVSFGYLHLIDNMTGANVDLLENPYYTFNAGYTDYASRFKLVFATKEGNDDNFAFYSNGSFIISNDGNATLQVVDVTGRIIKSESINGCASVNFNAAAGVYMIRLVNGNDVKVQKVVVK